MILLSSLRNNAVPALRSLRSLRAVALAAAPLVALLVTSGAAEAFVPAAGTDEESRWTLTAHGSTGSSGNPVRLTWSFVPDGTLVPHANDTTKTYPSDLIARLDATFGAGPGGADLTQRPWFTYFDQSFNRWSALSGLTYIYEPNDSSFFPLGTGIGLLGVRGDVRIGGTGMGTINPDNSRQNGLGGTLAYNFFPNSGDMGIDTDDLAGILADPANNYRSLRNVIMHEAGHGLGLDHVGSSSVPFLMNPSANTSFEGPQHDDLRGIHWLYGDVFEKAPAGRNETAALATPLGLLQSGSSLAIGTAGNGATIGPTETDFVSISNESDIDFFSFTVTTPVSLDLSMTPRGASYTQNGTSFNTMTTSNLSLALFASDGVTLLAEAASGAAGVTETISDITLSQPGTYYARVRGPVTTVEQVVQFYRLDLTASALAPPLLGDFNADGLVDAADYSVWRDQNGLFRAAYTGADHTGDGSVDAADYALWQTHYGATLSSFASAVPEPGAVLLSLVGCLLFGHPRRW